MTKNPDTKMLDLLKDAGTNLIPFKEGSLIEVEVISKSKKRILVDVKGLNLGVIPEKEFSADITDLEPGDKVLAYVVLSEDDKGYTVLSLRRSDRERFQKNLSESFKNKETVTVTVKEANRGGLIVEYNRQEGFLPSSQLASNHYPRVGSDKEKILGKLKELVGKSLKVKIITYDPANGKVIFSEKEAGDSLLVEKISQFKTGDVKEGTVTGVVNFGLFVEIEGVEGLVHISEVSWEKIEDLGKLFKPGDKIKAKIISLDSNRLSLSIKQLILDPWIKVAKAYSPKQIVDGTVTKISPFGAFVKLDKDINGLVHISEFNHGEEKNSHVSRVEDYLEVGKEYKFKIISVEPDVHKINLSLVAEKATPTKKKATKKSKK